MGYPKVGPYYLTVHPIATLVAGLVGGLVIGICIAWLVARPRQHEVITDLAGEPPQVPEGISSVLDVLSSSAVIVGPHDEVLEATTSARIQGLARGSEVAVPEVLDLVRSVRRERALRSLDLELVRGRGATSYLRVRVAPLPDDMVVVLADDETYARRIEETRRDFVVNISHELKTPIGAISFSPRQPRTLLTIRRRSSSPAG